VLAVVTATVDRERADPCLASWKQHAAGDYKLEVITNGGTHDYLGPVAAFRIGVESALQRFSECDVIACFHDDLVILESNWDETIEHCFREHPEVGLASFGGCTILGDDMLYHAPYHPDLLEAGELVHGVQPQRIVVPVPYCLIGRRAFWSGFHEVEWRTRQTRRKRMPRPWAVIDDLGMVDHWYEGALACLARRGGWQVRYLPVRCRHLKGQTTRDAGYQQWAAEEIEGGDRGFWEAAHRIGYDAFKDVLPLRLD